jgi:primosomal protein N' (replication factor Y) (superfamily II helicase)
MNICSNSQPVSLAEVAVDARFADRRTTLSYLIPAHLKGDLEVGQLVWAPLRKGLTVGVICEIHNRPIPGGVELRPVHAPVEPTFRLTPLQWALAVWMTEETICSLFEAASVMFPPGVETRGVEHLELIATPADTARITPLQKRLIDYLETHPNAPIGAARRALGSSLTTVVPALEDTGVVRRVVRVRNRPPTEPRLPETVRLVPGVEPPPERAPRQREAYNWLSARLRSRPDGTLPIKTLLQSDLIDRAVLRALVNRGVIAIETGQSANGSRGASHAAGPELTSEQHQAWGTIRPLLDTGHRAQVLLHGVTGSGKTEIYFRAAASVLASGKSAILLVPEIALASQVIERAVERFGTDAIILHSGMNDRERYDNWHRCASGEPVVVVGPRSALFAPIPNLGLVVVDEEQEAAYKQDSVPRYHARAVAMRLVEMHDALLILGSATPDVESYFRAGGPDWHLIELHERVGQRRIDTAGVVRGMSIALPSVRIVDMRAELRAGNRAIFSRQLMDVLRHRLASGEQSILFLNRRGSSTMVQCRTCGHVSSCPLCDIPMVYHRDGNRLTCHRCGYRTRPPQQCPACSSPEIGYYGAGTQRIEAEIRSLLPKARVQRWDRDVLRGKITHDILLRRIAQHEVDIIVGTQMVAKGLDLPDVTAVGVINADTFLHMPDFRSAERTFQMLTQVAGRAGRRASGAEVVIQSYSPEHYTIQHAASHDYSGFYREEIAFRGRHGYPPFKRITRLLYRHTDDIEAQMAANTFCAEVEHAIASSSLGTGIDILGPAPAFATRVRGRYGWQILLRGDNGPALMAGMKIPFGWAVDVDPVSLL